MAGTTTINGGYIGIGTTLSGDVLLINTTSGTILSGGIAVYEAAGLTPDTVSNAGTIASVESISSTPNPGISLASGGEVINQGTGVISGTTYGVVFSGGAGTLINSGQITAGAGFPDVRFAAGFSNRLVLYPGGDIVSADGGNTIGSGIVSTLELASATSAGTLTGIGSAFVDFAGVTIDPGANWTLTGTNVIAAGATLLDSGSLTNAGLLDASLGAFTDSGSLFNTGSILAGVVMTPGAWLDNEAGATMTGGIYAPTGGAARTIINAGTITRTDGTAINLQPDGTVSNVSGGTITGINAVDISGAASVSNRGEIQATGTTGSGVILRGGGTVTNEASASIVAQFYGVVVDTSVGMVTNSGTIHSGTLIGVAFNHGGTIGNTGTGIIAGHYDGASILGATGMVTNAGTITADSGRGVNLEAGGSVDNQTGGMISGASVGILIAADTGMVTNAGTIIGNSGTAVVLNAGGTVTNAALARISGYGGVGISGGAGTLINRGTIAASGPRAVVLTAGYANRVVLDPTASFTGTVDGGNTIGATVASTLELESAASTGTLSGIGTQFIDFSQIAIDSGASWAVTAATTLAAGITLTNDGTLTLNDTTLSDPGTLVNNGAILIDPSTLTIGDLIGTGSVTVEAGSTLEIGGTVSAGETVVFGGDGALLTLDNPGSISGSLSGLTPTQTIDLVGIAPGSVTFDTGHLDFALPGSGAGSILLQLAGGGSIHVTDDHAGGADVSATLCFLPDTMIGTPRGEVPVQHLARSDLVRTWAGATRPITWIGSGRVLATRGRRGAATPVIVRKGALGDNIPARDLRVTKGHSLFVDNVLIPVEFLVNHRSILWDDRAQEVTLYHVELDRHDVLIADGAPAESYRDDGNRWLFHNANNGWDAPPPPPCAPVLTGGPIVDAAWSRLLDRSGQRRGFPLTDDPDLHLTVDGRRMDATERNGSVYVFHLPAMPGQISIASRAAVPTELGLARDARQLGVALRRLVLRQGSRFELIEPNDTCFATGFYPYEPSCRARWTDGDAPLPMSLFTDISGPFELVLHLGGTTRYPLLAGMAA